MERAIHIAPVRSSARGSVWAGRVHTMARPCAPPSAMAVHCVRWTRSAEVQRGPSRPALGNVSSWQGWLYVAVVIDVFAERIVMWRMTFSMRLDFVLVVLEQALCVPSSPITTAG